MDNRPRIRIRDGKPLPNMGGGDSNVNDNISEVTEAIEKLSSVLIEKFAFLSMQVSKGDDLLSNTFNQALARIDGKPEGETERRKSPEVKPVSSENTSEGLKRAQQELDIEKLKKDIKEQSFLRNPFSGVVSRAKYNSMMSEQNKEDIAELRSVANDKSKPEKERLDAKEQILKIKKTKEEQFEAKNDNKKLLAGIEKLNSNILKGTAKAVAAGGMLGLVAMLFNPELAISGLAKVIEAVGGGIKMITALFDGDMGKAFEAFKSSGLLMTATLGALVVAIGQVIGPILSLITNLRLLGAIKSLGLAKVASSKSGASDVAKSAAAAGAASSVGTVMNSGRAAPAFTQFNRPPTPVSPTRGAPLSPAGTAGTVAGVLVADAIDDKLQKNKRGGGLSRAISGIAGGRRKVASKVIGGAATGLKNLFKGAGNYAKNNKLSTGFLGLSLAPFLFSGDEEAEQQVESVNKATSLEEKSKEMARKLMGFDNPLERSPSSLPYVPVGSTNNTSKFNNTQAQVSGAKPSTIVASGGSSSVINNSPSTTNNYVNNYAGANDVYKDLTLRNV